MIVLTAIGVVALVALPYVVRLENVSPATAIAVWFSSLVTRLLAVLLLLVWIAVFLPATELFTAATHWCLHAVVPSIAMHLGVDGHSFGDFATIAPVVAVSVSLSTVVYGLVRASRAVARFVRRSRIGYGPNSSVVVREPRVLIAVAGVTRPNVIVSSGAISELDGRELAASLEHERGHIGRRHQVVLLAAELCRALARFIPGTNRAMRELIFHVERDADEWALRHDHDPAVLASAICKAALAPRSVVSPALTGGAVARRVDLLLTGKARHRVHDAIALTLATAFTVVSLMMTVSLTNAIASPPAKSEAPALVFDC